MTGTTTDQYTRDAVTAIRDAIRAEGDFGGWLASVLATAAAAARELADPDEDDQDGPRLRGWEAQHVERLIDGGQVLTDAMPGDDPAAAAAARVASGAAALAAVDGWKDLAKLTETLAGAAADLATNSARLVTIADDCAGDLDSAAWRNAARHLTETRDGLTHVSAQLQLAAPELATGDREFMAKWRPGWQADQ